MKKRSLTIAGHRTSVSLEDPFWNALREAAGAQGRSLAGLVAEVDAARGRQSLSSALRLFVLEQLRRPAPSVTDAEGPRPDGRSAAAPPEAG